MAHALPTDVYTPAELVRVLEQLSTRSSTGIRNTPSRAPKYPGHSARALPAARSVAQLSACSALRATEAMTRHVTSSKLLVWPRCP